MADKDSKKKARNDAQERAAALREQAAAHAERERRNTMFRRRIEIARQGVRNYQLHRMGDAAKAFHLYLGVLEEWKGCGEGGLHPTHFDLKKDLPELLLITGVLWDMVKMYDQTESEKSAKEFRRFLDKYVVFSKGMPYHALSAESLRKYLGSSKVKHRAEMKAAYVRLTGSKCFVATSLVDVCEDETLETLRRFRDERLRRTRVGRSIVARYYRLGPRMALVMDRMPGAVRWAAGRGLDRVSWFLRQLTP